MTTKDEVLKRYPVGTKFIPIYTSGKPMSYHEEYISCGSLAPPNIKDNNMWWFGSQSGLVYYDGVWAKLVEPKITLNYLIL